MLPSIYKIFENNYVQPKHGEQSTIHSDHHFACFLCLQHWDDDEGRSITPSPMSWKVTREFIDQRKEEFSIN